jgi:hypothetical protein
MQREMIAQLREALAAAQQAQGAEVQEGAEQPGGGGGSGRPGSRERLSPLPTAAA